MNILKCLILVVFVCSVGKSEALETDNYLSWKVHLEDSSHEINDYINSKIGAVLTQANNESKKVSCNKLRERLVKTFRNLVVHKIEVWTERNLSDSKLYPGGSIKDGHYYNMSVYRISGLDIMRWIPLSRNINVNGYYFGTDKLSHFISTGYRYYEKYTKAIRKGSNVEDAIKKAINYGILLEVSVLGELGSGVFSYADLEANYQGFLFINSFCDNEQSEYVRYAGDRWELIKDFNISTYVNPYWDETFYVSHFAKRKWKAFRGHYRDNYCPIESSDLVQERLMYYRRYTKKSFSVNYIEELLKKNERVPELKTQARGNICDKI